MQIKNIKTKQEFEEFTNNLIGEGKDCEKNLFTALYLFIKDFCPADELDLEHVLAYDDDRYIYKIVIERFYSETPRTEVEKS